MLQCVIVGKPLSFVISLLFIRYRPLSSSFEIKISKRKHVSARLTQPHQIHRNINWICMVEVHAGCCPDCPCCPAECYSNRLDNMATCPTIICCLSGQPTSFPGWPFIPLLTHHSYHVFNPLLTCTILLLFIYLYTLQSMHSSFTNTPRLCVTVIIDWSSVSVRSRWQIWAAIEKYRNTLRKRLLMYEV